jgi:hypothetical protein
MTKVSTVYEPSDKRNVGRPGKRWKEQPLE